MKNLLKLIVIIGVLTCFAFAIIPTHQDVYKINKNESTVEWYAEKVTGKHNGTIKVADGEIKNDHGNYSGFIKIDMSTIENKDLSDEKYKAKLENHLKSADFFDAAKYPISTFVITSINLISNTDEKNFTHHIKGDLTIRDKTNAVEFDATIKLNASGIVCSGSAVIDRSKFDVKYGSKTFFEDIGDKAIYDNFTLKFNLVASK